MEESKKQIPNILTIIRVVLSFVCTYLAFKRMWIPSLAVFIIASVTDFLDGYLARKWNTESNFGKIMDPIADKLLILGVLFSFSMKEIVPLLFTAIIAFREVVLTIIRLMLAPKKIVIAASKSGKIKTTVQIGSLVSIYLLLIFNKLLQNYFSLKTLQYSTYILLILVVCVTIYSGIEFFILNRRAIKKLI